MVGGVSNQTVYRALVPLGACPHVLTGTGSALLYQAAAASAERAQAAYRDTTSAPPWQGMHRASKLPTTTTCSQLTTRQASIAGY